MATLQNFMNYKTIDRKAVMEEGKKRGSKRATDDYPYAVYRDRSSVERSADQAFEEWFREVTTGTNGPFFLNYWNSIPSNHPEGERLFIAAWVAGYEETVAKKDEATRPKVQPQLQPAQPATSTGTRVTVTKIDRSPDEYVYHLELTDPEYFDGIEKTEWVVYFEGASVPATEATRATTAYGMASSSVVYGSATPQKTARKPKGSYLRKPQ